MKPGADSTVRAAGALVWRRAAVGPLEVALVHRPKYEDWSWPKGKLDPGESWAGACVREVREETGLPVVLGLPLPHATYTVGNEGTARVKVVRYWAATAHGDAAGTDDEVDEVAWLPVDQAELRLDYLRDREQLRALVEADRRGHLDTWPLAVVRHARAVPRGRWKQPDVLRPLDDAGHERARDLVPVLSAYGLRQVVSSPAARCAETVEPYARGAGVRVRLVEGLSEEGFADAPASVVAVVEQLLAQGTAAAACSHRPVLPALLAVLADHTPDADVAALLRESAGPGLVKGEVLVAHVTGRGHGAAVVGVERQDTR